MAVKENHKIEKSHIENIAMSDDVGKEDAASETELDDGASYQSLMEKKQELTSDIRKAGVTSQDQDFMDSFSEAMTSEKKHKDDYTPSDTEISQDLNKAKEMNEKIFKETHPEEY